MEELDPPEWKEGDCCSRCRDEFTFTNRRHHCRNCGNIVCGSCSTGVMPLPHYGYKTAVRVCDTCARRIIKEDRPLGTKKPERLSRREQEEIERAIALSAAEFQAATAARDAKRRADFALLDEDDPDIRMAVLASLKDAREQEASAPEEEAPEGEAPLAAPSSSAPQEALDDPNRQQVLQDMNTKLGDAASMYDALVRAQASSATERRLRSAAQYYTPEAPVGYAATGTPVHLDREAQARAAVEYNIWLSHLQQAAQMGQAAPMQTGQAAQAAQPMQMGQAAPMQMGQATTVQTGQPVEPVEPVQAASPAAQSVPAQPMPAQSMPAQSMPAQSIPAQSMPAQSMPAQPNPVLTPAALSLPAVPTRQPMAFPNVPAEAPHRTQPVMGELLEL